MKFQCGECDKFFKIDNINTIEDDLSFHCDNCNNQFVINRNLRFSSSSENSKLICENCGKLISESHTACTSCNLILNKTHEELKIDNKHYAPLEINNNGTISNTLSGKNLRRRSLLIPGMLTLCVLLAISLFYVLSNKQNMPNIANFTVPDAVAGLFSKSGEKEETHIVILNSGKTYYAKKIDHDGMYVKIIDKNGMISEVLKTDILQISKATINN